MRCVLLWVAVAVAAGNMMGCLRHSVAHSCTLCPDRRELPTPLTRKQRVARWCQLHSIGVRLGFGRLRDWCASVTGTATFKWGIGACIVLNTVSLAVDHYGIDATTSDVLADINLFFTILFTVEMVMMLMSLGFYGYCSDRFNVRGNAVLAWPRAVCVCVCASVRVCEACSMAIDIVGLLVGAAFRWLHRHHVLCGSVGGRWEWIDRLPLSTHLPHCTLGAILGKHADDFASCGSVIVIVRVRAADCGGSIVPAPHAHGIVHSYIAALLMLFCFIYSILGMQLFGGQMGSGDDLPRNNFDTLHWSFISVFQILSGEAWNEIMYIGVAAGGWGTVVFFISWVIIGQYILLNVRSMVRRSPVGPLAHGW